MKMGPMGCPETSLRKYYYTLRNNPQEHRSHLQCGGSLKSRAVKFTFMKKYEEGKLRISGPGSSVGIATGYGLDG
jgi:hypothetical protein